MLKQDFDRDHELAYSRPRNQSPRKTLPLLVFVLALVGGGLGWALWLRATWFNVRPDHDPAAQARIIMPRGDLGAEERSTIDLYNATKPTVVNITTLANRQGFTLNQEQVPEGTGSGFIWDDQGHLVTNFHVIRNADAAQVTMSDHSSWPARLIGAFPDKDLAVLKIDAPKSKLVPIPVGRSDDLQVGQKVYAIGNPFGLDQTLTNGIISALGREIQSVNQRPIKGMIQTNAAINPGNSGGPLLDSAGRLIGVNTAIFSPSGASAGIGFAIPVDEVNRVVPELIRNGKVNRPGMGIQIAADQVLKQMNQDGVLILGVKPGSSAEQAGLLPTKRDANGQVVLGDIIKAIDDVPIKKANDLHGALENKKPGDVVNVHVLRDGMELDLDVRLIQLE